MQVSHTHRRLNIGNMSRVLKLVADSAQFQSKPNSVFEENEKLFLKFMQKCKEPRIWNPAQIRTTNLGDLTVLQLKTWYKVTVVDKKVVLVCRQRDLWHTPGSRYRAINTCSTNFGKKRCKSSLVEKNIFVFLPLVSYTVSIHSHACYCNFYLYKLDKSSSVFGNVAYLLI